MKSFLGSTIAQGSGILAYTSTIQEAERLKEEFKIIFREFSIKILNLSSIEERLVAINLDPDLADFREGYVIAIGI
ncbi:hypothetical protein [Stygiolobus caldivivus]|uniref:Uncharacterized protein n=1 Tax=Stygiolobus caldivivus TaxID=2824673 RepID=A0A8D5ZFX3_9CREN|nr:hypothetical protein [Stygiolobus caldivivus]BCU70528.1 hypothetical protein KN1_18250 [Stygiolobus caldivivus]